MSPIEKTLPATSQTSALPTKGFIARLVANQFAVATVGSIRITLPNGQQIAHRGAAEGPHAEIHFRSWRSLLGYYFGGDLSFAESFMAGDVDIADLNNLFDWYLRNEKALEAGSKPGLVKRILDRFDHLVLNDNSKAGSQKNISYHYDLGNDFYAHWLDRSMTYSSAIFKSFDEDHEIAQARKYQRMLDEAGVEDDSAVLEIGCGWGGFAEHILTHAKPSHYEGVTISRRQLNYAKDRLIALGQNPEQLKFQDYRDIDGQFDAIISIEMFEAVGEKHWDTYFQTIQKLLKDGGKATIQVITIEHQRYLKYRKAVDFIQKYIFPGGMLPSQEVFAERAVAAGLEVDKSYAFGSSYAESLRRWRADFDGAWPEIECQGFDNSFYRMWSYYLTYCEAGFDAGAIDVVQFTLTKPIKGVAA